jgi:hypothetical protein
MQWHERLNPVQQGYVTARAHLRNSVYFYFLSTNYYFLLLTIFIWMPRKSKQKIWKSKQ